MKFNKIAKKFAAAALAGVLAVSMMGMSVSADNPAAATGETSVTSISFTKTVLTDGNTYAPNTTFTFTVNPGEAGTFTDSSQSTYTVVAGPTGGLTTEGVTFAPDTTQPTDESYSGTGTLKIDEDLLTKEGEGIYHYVMYEDSTDYEGITVGGEKYDIYVFVYNKEDMSGYYVAYVLVQENGKTAKSSELTFTNDYGGTVDPENPDGSTHDVTVTKKIKGTAANVNDTFAFEVKITGASGEAYKVVYTVGGVEQSATSVVSGNTIKLEGLGQNDTVTIYGLTASDTYTVKEVDSKGYTATITDGTNGDTVTGNATKDGSNETITNTKNYETPTGITLSIAPYVLMVAFAGVIAVLFLRKRNYKI